MEISDLLGEGEEEVIRSYLDSRERYATRIFSADDEYSLFMLSTIKIELAQSQLLVNFI